VRAALDQFVPLIGQQAVDGFWASAGKNDGPTTGRSACVSGWLTWIEHRLGRYHDDAPSMIEWKWGKRYSVGMSLTELANEELLVRWAAIECADDGGTCPERNELADEIERRGLDA
jgi:hypothetical protein